MPIIRDQLDNGSYTRSVRAGDFVFIGGQVGEDENDAIVPGGAGPETRQAIANIAAALAVHGLGLEHVVKCTCFLSDTADFKVFNDTYREFFAAHLPARATLRADMMGPYRVEIEAVAYAGA